MPSGTGTGDLEVRLINLERKAYSPEIYNLERRVAALEQGRFQQAGAGGSPGSQFAVAVVGGSTIGPGTATTPASGTVTIQTFDGTTVSATTTTVTAYCDWDKTIAAGAQVKIATDSLGFWWIVDPRSCSDLS